MINLVFNSKIIKNVSDLKNLKARGIKGVIFAETHGFVDDIELQRSIIEAIKSEYYIWEMLEEKNLMNRGDFESFLSNKDNSDFSVISTYGELKAIVKLMSQLGIKGIGCDLRNMGRENKDFLSKTELTAEEEKFEEELLKKRELHQAKVINDTAGKGSSPVFVSLGAYHTREDSLVLKNLRGKYLLCSPTFKGEKVFCPDGIKKEEINYSIEEIG
jgi:hypothetical protein